MAVTAAQGGSAAGDLFQGIAGYVGGMAEAKAYKKAAKFAAQNAIISREAGDIKLDQTGRQIFKTIGAQAAGYAGAGLTAGGSAQSILRDSISQGALEKAIVNAQANIDVNGYLSQEAQFKGMAKASKMGAWGSLVGGITSAAGTIAMASDRRLKTDIIKVGTHGNLNIHSFRYIGDNKLRVGVMADEVAIHAPHALGPEINGYATVYYDKLGLGHLLEMG